MISVLKSSFNQDPKGHLFSLRDAFPIQSYCIIIKLCESFVVQISKLLVAQNILFVLIYMEIQYRRKKFNLWSQEMCKNCFKSSTLFFWQRLMYDQ